jgi:hypothetical protein
VGITRDAVCSYFGNEDKHEARKLKISERGSKTTRSRISSATPSSVGAEFNEIQDSTAVSGRKKNAFCRVSSLLGAVIMPT